MRHITDKHPNRRFARWASIDNGIVSINDITKEGIESIKTCKFLVHTTYIV